MVWLNVLDFGLFIVSCYLVLIVLRLFITLCCLLVCLRLFVCSVCLLVFAVVLLFWWCLLGCLRCICDYVRFVYVGLICGCLLVCCFLVYFVVF